MQADDNDNDPQRNNEPKPLRYPYEYECVRQTSLLEIASYSLLPLHSVVPQNSRDDNIILSCHSHTLISLLYTYTYTHLCRTVAISTTPPATDTTIPQPKPKVTLQESAETFGGSKQRPDKQFDTVLITDALSDVRVK